MRFRTLGLWATFTILLLPLTSLAGPPPKIYIQDIQPEAGIDEKVARSLSDLLELEIERGGIFTVVSQQDVRRLLSLESQRLLLGTETDDDLKRMAAIAKNLDAPYALASSVGKVGSTYVLSLRLIDVQEVKVIRRISQTLVGDEQGLIGSLRAAALGLNLEQKGLSPDISEQLIEKLKIAEKEKVLFLSLSPSYEFGLAGSGAKTNQKGVINLRPAFMDVRLSMEMPIWRWLRAYGSLAFGSTLNEREHYQTLLLAKLNDGLPNESTLFQGVATYQPYSVLHLPVSLGIKAIPERGSFLPFASLGIGFSWQKYSFATGNMDIFQENLSGDPCVPPFTDPENEDFQDACYIDTINLTASESPSLIALDLDMAAGIDWLLTHHIGLRIEARYRFSYVPKSSEDLQIEFEGESDPDLDGTVSTVTKFGLQAVRHGLSFSAGMVVYW